MRKVMVPLLAVWLAACTERPLQTARDMAPPPLPSAGPGMSPSVAIPEAVALVLPSGYGAMPVAIQLSDPRALLFDAAGRLLVLEGEAARLSRIEADGSATPLAQGGGNGPWTGAASLGGRLFVAESGGPLGGRILAIGPNGAIKPLAVTLPGGGLVGPLAAGPDGALYVGIASAAARGSRADIPCEDRTGKAGQHLEGAVPCTGAVLRLLLEDGSVEIHSWGWRAPAALTFAADGRLLVAEQVAEDAVLHLAMAGLWYGWPDSQLAAADPAEIDLPNPPPAPLASVVGSAAGLAATDRESFGGADEVFLTLATPDGQGVVAFTAIGGGIPVPFAANLRRPQALAFAPGADALFVADAGTGTLWRITPYAAPLPPAAPSATSVPNPRRSPAWKIRA